MQLAGIKVAKGVDIDQSCKETYELNCQPAKFLKGDIRTIKLEEVFRGVSIRPSDKVLFSACLPCQPFSHHRKVGEGDERLPLAMAFLRLVREGRPDFVFSENVPGFQKALGGKLFNGFLAGLWRAGYKCTYQVVPAEQYGVPQRRRRFILLASRFAKPTFAKPTHGQGGPPYLTVRDAIGRFPPLSAGEKDPNVPNHATLGLSPANLLRIRGTPKDGGGREAWPVGLSLRCHANGKVGYRDVYGRMEWDKPAPTLTTKCVSLSNGRFGHPEQDRAISVREAAAIQGFEDGFQFLAPLTVAARHVGNAVPPPLAKVLVQSFLHQP